VKHQLVPFFGGKIITELKPKDVEEYRAQRVGKNGQPVSLQSVNHDHATLKHYLNIAVRRGLMSSNPASRVPVPNPQKERDRVLSQEE
jgi:site-specific recombinase XerD